ncbi:MULTISPECIES: hypothetical protein [unclassified Mesorhizobium]|uniref:hypothetical protein n=1 Tax=unclassified Mesorhizobium TaxID=325217 RepID=UPI0003CFB9B5|nr:hypothetical protein [Mesorhizobium sp. L48C026A00]ESZ04456.1 hypothetical protein X737_36830 [Mesorhizobium sp. L48C026A00]
MFDRGDTPHDQVLTCGLANAKSETNPLTDDVEVPVCGDQLDRDPRKLRRKSV